MTSIKKSNPLTALDIFNAIICMIVGIVISYLASISNIPHNGFIVLGGLGLGIFGVIRFLIKYFKQPIQPQGEDQNGAM